MNRVPLLLLFLVVVLTGCLKQPHETYTVSTEFDKKFAEAQLRPGKNTIIGSAMLRQSTGVVVTCAGQEVELIPATDYARERLSKMYQGEEKGYNPVMMDNQYRRIISSQVSAEYVQAMVRTIANPLGFFKFERVADGTYYIVTTVSWMAGPYKPQGGALMQRVHVSGGEIKEFVLTYPSIGWQGRKTLKVAH